ncbi:hypothetical protein GCM10007053_06410 [Halioglobus pacificus]|uniref:Uncharacterized protein n=1 Tax=Parahalioglobus pacificus TaxID=930806 RepID=A0A918XE36_9GAMM|nr:hypothetical protein GCM10007053_06410 [Halioglobus pacificus]
MAAIYDQIGAGYDTARRADPEIASQLASLVMLQQNADYLDLPWAVVGWRWTHPPPCWRRRSTNARVCSGAA